MELASIKDPVEAYETMTRVAQTADEVGFESAWLGDHFYTTPQPSQNVTFECWTTTAALARDTKRIRIGQMVTCNGYRNPALLAKMASTVDVMSHGRLDFGIGAGWYEHEYRAYGYDYPDAPERLRYLREAIQVILAMWTQDEAVFEGKYYQARGAINQAILKQHCETVGRDYDSIRRTSSTICVIGATEEAAMATLNPPQRALVDMMRASALIGTPETIRQRLTEYENAGIQELILWFPDATKLTSLRLFAKECRV